MGVLVFTKIPAWALTGAVKHAVFRTPYHPTFSEDASIEIFTKEKHTYEVRIDGDIVTVTPPRIKPEYQIDISNIVRALLITLKSIKENRYIMARTQDNKYRLNVAVQRNGSCPKAVVFGTLNIIKGERFTKPDWIIKFEKWEYPIGNIVVVEYDDNDDVKATGIVLGLSIKCKSESETKKFDMYTSLIPVRLKRVLLAKLVDHANSLEIDIKEEVNVSWETIHTAFQVIEDALEHIAGAVLAESL